RARDFDRLADRCHREPVLGSDSYRNRCFFGPAATSSASLKSRPPASSCRADVEVRVSVLLLRAAACVAVNAPCSASLQQVKSSLGETPRRRAERLSVAPGSPLSALTCSPSCPRLQGESVPVLPLVGACCELSWCEPVKARVCSVCVVVDPPCF